MLMIAGMLPIVPACGQSTDVVADDRASHKPASGMSVQISSDRTPGVSEEVTLTCAYKIDYPDADAYGTEHVVRGYFNAPRPEFEFVSGDSSWVDTLRSNTAASRSAVFRAMQPGRHYADAFTSSVLEEDILVIGGSSSILLDVR